MPYGGQAVEQEERVERAVSSCRHHWVIGTPSGPVSEGLCRLCGEARAFRNHLGGSDWENDVSLDEVSTGSRYPASLIGSSDAGADEG